MLNINDLWIGETLRVLSSGRIGRFEGVAKDGRARVSSLGKVYLIKPSNIELYEEPEIDKVELIKKELSATAPKSSFKDQPNQIDLHIEQLDPKMINALPEHILNHQLKACRSFINDSIKSRSFSVTIIHGKGMGVLRSEVLELLKGVAEVQLIEEVNNGGAQRIYFKY